MSATCPECQQLKHGNCDGTALDDNTDQIVKCVCHAHDHLPRAEWACAADLAAAQGGFDWVGVAIARGVLIAEKGREAADMIARVEALHARKHQCIGGAVYSETDPCPTLSAVRGPCPTGDGAE